MNIEYFYYFREVADGLSISKAAHVYHMTQQGMSRAIGQIEREYDVRLFNRAGSTISLTEAGASFLEYAKRIIENHNLLNDSMNHFRSKEVASENETITVYVTHNVAFNIWPSLRRRLAAACPDTAFNVREMWQTDMVGELGLVPKSNAFGLVTLPSTFSDILRTTSICLQPLMDIELMAYVAKNSPYAKRNTITLDELASAKLAMLDDAGLDLMLTTLIGRDRYAKVNAFRTSNRDLLEEEILYNGAVGFTNTFVKNYCLKDGITIIGIEQTFKTPLYLMTSALAELNEPARKAIDSLASIVTEVYSEVAFSSSAS